MLATYTGQRWLRQLLLSLPPLGVSVPAFWVGLMLVELFSFRRHWFPAFGNDGLRGLVLPAVTLAVPTGALVAQVLAKSLFTALAEPYIDTARAKGAGRVRIHLRHALRNASLPALTIVGLLCGQLLANSVVIETVFSRNGLGRVTAAAVTVQDIPLVQGVVVFGALIFVLVNLLVDLVYPLLDPRIVVATTRQRSLA
jgi:peptide/nickel transport system permease protein